VNIDEFIYELGNPQVYTGREINAVKKPVEEFQDFVNVCLVFPDKYEIGMSHYGLVILYHLLNNMPHVNAERCFLPGKESIDIFKERRVPLFSLENKVPLSEFDVVSFSLLSEMNYTNVLQVLDLAGLPLWSRERKSDFPIIAAGGISVVNPEPLRDFIDVFGLGDGESLFPDIIEAVTAAKQKQNSNQSGKVSGKQGILEQLDGLEGLYVPSLHPPVKRGRFFVPDIPEGSLKKRALNSLRVPEAMAHERTIVPIGNVVFSRLNSEIARGCPQNCRFCQAKSYYAPYRARSLEANIRQISHGLKETGFESFSLSTLSTGDYPELEPLLELIPETAAAVPGVSFSLSSLRPSTLSNQLLCTMALFKRSGITIVPEAGTQRLRNVINKDVTDEEIFNAVDLALKNKWQKIKLYFMLGLPTETDEDLDGIGLLIQKIVEKARLAKQRVKISVSFSPFVPKPQTPLQWAKREDMEELFRKIRYIKKFLKPLGKRIDVDFHTPHNSVVETILARGDYRVGELLHKMFLKGQIFSAWDREFDFASWAEEIFDTEPGFGLFLEEIPVDEPLPWDNWSVNFKKDYLIKEYRNALSATPTPGCSRMNCAECGGCRFGKKVEQPAEAQQIEDLKREITSLRAISADISEFKKVRFIYEKTGDFVFFSQLAMNQYLERLIRRAGIVFKCSEGFTPRIKMASLPALSVFARSYCEVVELFVDSSLSTETILEMLKRSGEPEGFRFIAVMECEGRPSLSKDIQSITHEIVVDNLSERIEELSNNLEETDSYTCSGDLLTLTMDYTKMGPERFGKFYKLIDPEKARTRYLTRRLVTFKSPPTDKKQENQ
jgi:radical SAM family uncharacterized protein